VLIIDPDHVNQTIFSEYGAQCCIPFIVVDIAFHGEGDLFKILPFQVSGNLNVAHMGVFHISVESGTPVFQAKILPDLYQVIIGFHFSVF